MPVVGWLAALLLAPSAAFARQPLVIVAEATADAGITAAEIRKAVTAELGEDAAEPSGENATASDVLFIATNARRAVLAFCPNNPNDGEVRRRTIELPDDSNDRKKTIAWIALNLVRNQVADLGGIEPSPHPTEPPAQKPAPALPANQGSPPPASQPSEDAHSASAPTVQAELDDHAPSPWRVAAFAASNASTSPPLKKQRHQGSDCAVSPSWSQRCGQTVASRHYHPRAGTSRDKCI